MAIPTVMGTEIEFGIMVKNDPDFDPISSCVLIVNAYREDPDGKILWDYDQENPLADARGFQVEGEKYTPNQQENIARNKTLINGARFYVDHAHPEYSSPEVTNARDLVIHEKAGERIIEISRREADQLLPAGAKMLIYKNNSDRKGNSYGCHENYLMDRRTSFKQVVEPLLPFFATRQIWCGAGKVGSENRGQPCDYQLSQRADFFETEVALDTMVKRPIVNTRDEPHADREKYRRLHVIVGDSNMSEYTIYLRNGVTALILSMIEDGAITKNLSLRDPVRSIREVSHDLSLTQEFSMDDGISRTAIEIQNDFLEMALACARSGSDGARYEDRLDHQEAARRELHGSQEARLGRFPGFDARSSVPRFTTGQRALSSARAPGEGRTHRDRWGDRTRDLPSASGYAGLFPWRMSAPVPERSLRGELGFDFLRARG